MLNMRAFSWILVSPGLYCCHPNFWQIIWSHLIRNDYWVIMSCHLPLKNITWNSINGEGGVFRSESRLFVEELLYLQKTQLSPERGGGKKVWTRLLPRRIKLTLPIGVKWSVVRITLYLIFQLKTKFKCSVESLLGDRKFPTRYLIS